MTTIWDERLLGRHRAADIAGQQQVKLDGEYLRCGDCDMNIQQMREGSLYSVDDIIAATVRHLSTTAHAVPLSGRGLNGANNSAIDSASSNRRRRRSADPVY